MGSAVRFSNNPQLSQYIRAANAIPLLAAEEEYTLAQRWREQRDAGAARKLVEAHLRLVVKIAVDYRHYGAPLDELIGEGNVGLMQAIARFDPGQGARVSTYATWWIRAAIQEFVMHTSSLVRIGTTGAQKKLFFNLRRLKRMIQAMEDGDLRPDQVDRIAVMLGVPEHEVISMNRRLAAPDSSLNEPIGADGSGEMQDRLSDEGPDQERTIIEQDERDHLRGRLRAALTILNARERHIIVERRLKEVPMTLHDIGLRFGVSAERVRQIEERAFTKLQRAMISGRPSRSVGTYRSGLGQPAMAA